MAEAFWNLIVILFKFIGPSLIGALVLILLCSFFIIRIPSVSGRVSARTSGKLTRKIKGNVIPFYGKKGTGLYKNPVRSVKNKVYRSRSKKLF